MATGLIALLDDIAAIAKAAAASLDDIATQTAKASVKAAGVVIDDTAVTPTYVIGLAPARELPIIGKIALGSLKNKLIFLLPICLVLGYFAPWLITPLLMIGGIYLSFEGAEKLHEAFFPHVTKHDQAQNAALDAADLESRKVSGAIRTDFILSAEIMALTLAGVSTLSIYSQAAVLATVGILITAAVYGLVAPHRQSRRCGTAPGKGRKPFSKQSRSGPRERRARAFEDIGYRRDCGNAVGRWKHHRAQSGGAWIASTRASD
ncbi:putative DNA repair protein MutK [Agrobacterium pusense]|nr:putative DNA repair protein MutK [Agrobacterium pusense]